MDAELGPVDGLAPFSRLILDLRGVCFVIERETLMSLPESILLTLFPNGLILADQSEEGDGDNSQDKHVYYVDFVLSFFRRAQEYFYGNDSIPGVYQGAGLNPSYLECMDPLNGGFMNGVGQPFHLPLFHKQPVIVLREELEYFVIPPASMKNTAAVPAASPNVPPAASFEFSRLKDACGEMLLKRQQIFTALQRNINKENNVAEQHLIDMLCMSGFEYNDLWGYRVREPSRCGITSTALVLLKTGVTHPGELPDFRPAGMPLLRKPIGVQRAGVDMEAGIDPQSVLPGEGELGEWIDDGQGGSVCVNQQQLATTQKLLLFWRKPARKCWWDGVDIVVPHNGMRKRQAVSPAALSAMSPQERTWLEQGTGLLVRVWIRRVWTLEVSLVGTRRSAV